MQEDIDLCFEENGAATLQGNGLFSLNRIFQVPRRDDLVCKFSFFGGASTMDSLMMDRDTSL